MGFLRGFSIAMGANIIVFVLSFINNKLIYMFLSQADNGFFRLFQQSVLFFALFAGDWLRLSNLNIAGENKKYIPSLSSNGLWLGFIVFIILSILVMVFRGILSGLFYGFTWSQLILLAFAGCLFIARNNWQSLLLVTHKMVSYSLTFVIWIVVFIFLNILFIVTGNFSVKSVMSGFIFATICCTLWGFFANRKFNGHSPGPSFFLIKKSAKIGTRAWIAVVGMFLMLQIHLFILKPFAGNPLRGLELVAIFSICYNFFMLFQHGADVAGTVLFSHVVQQDNESGSKLTVKVARNTLLLSFIFVLAGALFAKLLIILIADSRYLSAYIPLLIILPGIVAVNAGSVINSYFWGNGYPSKIIIAPYIATVIGIIIDALLIPIYGVSAASFSFSFISVCWFIYLIFIFSNDTGIRIKNVILPDISDFTGVFNRMKTILVRREN